MCVTAVLRENTIFLVGCFLDGEEQCKNAFNKIAE